MAFATGSAKTAKSGMASSRSALPSSHDADITIPLGQYKGLFGTMYHIVFEEGSRNPPTIAAAAHAATDLARSTGRAETVQRQPLLQRGRRKGQGIEGLWRGWRVGLWGLVGVWGAGLMNGSGGSRSGEF